MKYCFAIYYDYDIKKYLTSPYIGVSARWRWLLRRRIFRYILNQYINPEVLDKKEMRFITQTDRQGRILTEFHKVEVIER